MNSLIFAVDFDGTIVDDEFPEIGALKPGAIRVMNHLYKAGHYVIIWTCRTNTKERKYMNEVWDFLRSNGFDPYTINVNIDPELPFGDPKVVADYYLDDKSFPPFPGWLAFEREMEIRDIL